MSDAYANYRRTAFSNSADEQLSALCAGLAKKLSTKLSEGATVLSLIESLRSHDHGLWSFDDDGEGHEVWCADWTKQRAGGELLLEFRTPSWCQVSWKVGDHVTEAECGEVEPES